MKITWTNTANIDNLENIEYLLEEWSLKVVLDYEEKIIQTEKLLLNHPYSGIFDRELGLYKRLVVPQIYMIYEILRDEILIMRIWNNNQKPYW